MRKCINKPAAELKDRRLGYWLAVGSGDALTHSEPQSPHLQNRGPNQRISGLPLPRHLFDFAIHLISPKSFLRPAAPSVLQCVPPWTCLYHSSFALQLFCACQMAPKSVHFNNCPQIPLPPGACGTSEPTDSFQVSTTTLTKIRRWVHGRKNKQLTEFKSTRPLVESRACFLNKYHGC